MPQFQHAIPSRRTRRERDKEARVILYRYHTKTRLLEPPCYREALKYTREPFPVKIEWRDSDRETLAHCTGSDCP